MKSWLQRLRSRIGNTGGTGAVPSEILALLPDRASAPLREMLKKTLEAGHGFAAEELLGRAKVAGWSHLELDKLRAYCEFYSGRSATAYQRVLSNRLAVGDHDLLMTTLFHCYTHGRHTEGWALLRDIGLDEPDTCARELPDLPLDFAGLFALAGDGNILRAVAFFDRALDHGDATAQLVANTYTTFFEAGRIEQADRVRRLAAGRELTPDAIYSLAYVELARDYYPEGFRLAEIRYAMQEADKIINPSLRSRPRWSGEPLAGKRILVHGEQGHGDVIMMSRYLPLLHETAAEVIVDAPPAAVPLLAASFPSCRVVAGDIERPIAVDFDLWTGMMSLPFHFETTASTVPATSGYLSIPVEQAGYWRKRVSQLARPGKVRIGIAWSGNPSHRADKRRSIALERLAPLLDEFRASADFFALQTTVLGPLPANLINVSDELITLADTAALIDEMDLVLTVDTSIVHIAGAIGKSAWLLLPYRYEWRWSLVGEGNNWYESVRVLRQPLPGDWTALMAKVFGVYLPDFLHQRPESALATT